MVKMAYFAYENARVFGGELPKLDGGHRDSGKEILPETGAVAKEKLFNS